MYFRIYKALNVLLWMIPCRKKYWRDGGQHAFASMSVLLKDFNFA